MKFLVGGGVVVVKAVIDGIGCHAPTSMTPSGVLGTALTIQARLNALQLNT